MKAYVVEFPALALAVESDTEMDFAYGHGPGTLTVSHIRHADEPDEPSDEEKREAFAAFQRPRPLRNLVVALVARRGQVSEAVAAQALDAALEASDRPLWDWLRSGGLEDLIKLILSLLPLFGVPLKAA